MAMTKEGFSSENPKLRLAWDATTLAAYMRDPLAYYWQYVEGYGSLVPSTALVWGALWGEVTAEFKRLRANSHDFDEALRRTMRFAIARAREVRLNEIASMGKKDDIQKRNIYTLVRSLIWWAEHYRDDTLVPVVENGKIALELHYALPLPFKAYTGENYVLTGYFDEFVQDTEEGDYWVLERKHTTRTISDYYFYTYNPSVQIFTYDLVGSIMLPGKQLRGVIVEALQTAVTFSRPERHEIRRTPLQREHWAGVIEYWIRRAEQDARENSWQFAMNTETSSFDSVYKEIQRRDPSSWRGLLDTDLVKRPLWNPLEPRTIPTITEGGD